LESAQDFGRLICRDAASDTQRYFFLGGRAVQESLGAGGDLPEIKDQCNIAETRAQWSLGEGLVQSATFQKIAF
jgi:hypothetical protein